MAYKIGGVYETVTSTDNLVAYSSCGYCLNDNCWRVDDDAVRSYFTSNHGWLLTGACSNASDFVWGTKYFENCTDHPKLVNLQLTFAKFDSDGSGCASPYPYSWNVRWFYKNQSFILDAHTCACLPYTEHTPAKLNCCTATSTYCPIILDWRVQFSPLFVPVNYTGYSYKCPAKPYWEGQELCIPVYTQTNNVISLTCCSGWGGSNPSFVNLTSNTIIAYSPCTVSEQGYQYAYMAPTYTSYDTGNVSWLPLRTSWSNMACFCNRSCLVSCTYDSAAPLKYKSDTIQLKSSVLGNSGGILVFKHNGYTKCAYSDCYDERYVCCGSGGYLPGLWQGLAVRALEMDGKLTLGKVSCVEEVN